MLVIPLQALSSNDPAIVLQLCSRLDLKMLFHGNGRSMLSQAVILSLLHHLSQDLDQYPEVKLSWLEDVVARVDLAVSIQVFIFITSYL